MSVLVSFELPEDVFSALRSTPEEFVRQMRLASAVKWYELGLLSQAKAAELAGLDRRSFVESLARFNVSPFQLTAEELADEARRD